MSGWERGDDRVEACVGMDCTSCLACYHVCRSMLCSTEEGLNVKDSI